MPKKDGLQLSLQTLHCPSGWDCCQVLSGGHEVPLACRFTCSHAHKPLTQIPDFPSTGNSNSLTHQPFLKCPIHTTMRRRFSSVFMTHLPNSTPAPQENRATHNSRILDTPTQKETKIPAFPSPFWFPSTYAKPCRPFPTFSKFREQSQVSGVRYKIWQR